MQSHITYKKGQWAPHNPTGQKKYDREQLLMLRNAKASQIPPDMSTFNASILKPNPLPSFMIAQSTTASSSHTSTLSTLSSVSDQKECHAMQSHITYKKGQWAPHSPTGQKKYDCEQLLMLRNAKASQKPPNVSMLDALILFKPNRLPSFMRVEYTTDSSSPTSTPSTLPSVSDQKEFHAMQSRRTYKKRQGSPHNPTGQKKYDRKQQMLLRNSNASRMPPDSSMIDASILLKPKIEIGSMGDCSGIGAGNITEPLVDIAAHDSEDHKPGFNPLADEFIMLKIDTNGKVNDVKELMDNRGGRNDDGSDRDMNASSIQ